MEIYKKLYKINRNGKILEWYLEREENKYRTISGQQDGKYTTSKWTEAKAKNCGKKNGTTSIEQANKECLAKYEKKLKGGGYVSDLKDAVKFTYTKPMLADTYYSEKWNPETNEVKVTDNRPSEESLAAGEYVIQPKLDGIRCIASKEGLFTRKGEKILGVPHIEERLNKFFEYVDIKLDGELYVHNEDFNNISGTIRREPDKDNEEQALFRSSIEYFVYDIVSEEPYVNRVIILDMVASDFPTKVYNLARTKISNREEIEILHDSYVSNGYEGAILRNLQAKYQSGKRTRDLLKVKKFEDAEFTITDILEGEGNHSELATKIEIEDNGIKVYPSMTGRAEFKELILKEKDQYIGGQVTVKFFGRTPDGSLRHPSVKSLYKDKRDM